MALSQRPTGNANHEGGRLNVARCKWMLQAHESQESQGQVSRASLAFNRSFDEHQLVHSCILAYCCYSRPKLTLKLQHPGRSRLPPGRAPWLPFWPIMSIENTWSRNSNSVCTDRRSCVVVGSWIPFTAASESMSAVEEETRKNG